MRRYQMTSANYFLRVFMGFSQKVISKLLNARNKGPILHNEFTGETYMITMMKYTLAAMLWMTSVTMDKQVILTENGAEIAWSFSLTTSESLAVEVNNY